MHSRRSRILHKSMEQGLATITHNISRLSVHRDPEMTGISHPNVASSILQVEEHNITELCAGNVPPKQAVIRRTLGVTDSIFESFLGSIRATSTTTLRIPRQKVNITSHREQDQHEYKTSYTISPASWLVRLGIDYGLQLSFVSSSRGWKNTLNSFCTVPDDALIFEFCKQGNIPAVRTLLSGGHASVRDTNSEGYTPLHVSSIRET